MFVIVIVIVILFVIVLSVIDIVSIVLAKGIIRIAFDCFISSEIQWAYALSLPTLLPASKKGGYYWVSYIY